MDITKAYDFTDRTVVVTGGTGILCSAMVRALVRCGANVAVLARNIDKGEGLVHSLMAGEKGNGKAEAIKGDVLDKAALAHAADEIISRFGTIHALINGAGGNSPQATTGPDQTFFDLPEEGLRYVFDLNFVGTVLPTQVFGKRMAEQGDGAILNISSMSAIKPLTRVISYSAAKAAIDNFTQWLAVYLAREYSPGLRVNAVAPGFFVTEQNRDLLVDEASGKLTERGESIISHTPMGRFGDPEDLIGAVLWLLSPASSFVTGVVVPIDGGFSAFSGV